MLARLRPAWLNRYNSSTLPNHVLKYFLNTYSLWVVHSILALFPPKFTSNTRGFWAVLNILALFTPKFVSNTEGFWAILNILTLFTTKFASNTEGLFAKLKPTSSPTKSNPVSTVSSKRSSSVKMKMLKSSRSSVSSNKETTYGQTGKSEPASQSDCEEHDNQLEHIAQV